MPTFRFVDSVELNLWYIPQIIIQDLLTQYKEYMGGNRFHRKEPSRVTDTDFKLLYIK